MKPPASRPEGCLSDFALDRRLARELGGADAAAAEAHLADCKRCGARAAELSRERDAFAKDAPPLRLPGALAPEVPKRRRFLGAGAGGALALAAAVALFFTFRAPRPGGDDGHGTRSKGDAAKLGFYVNHAGSVRLGGPGEHVAAGDGLRFVVTTTEPRFVGVLSVDGARHASIYYPSASDAAPVLPGTRVALPESTTLDDTTGDETLYGIFCPDRFALEPLRRALEASPDRPPALDGCTVDVVRVRKEAAAAP